MAAGATIHQQELPGRPTLPRITTRNTPTSRLPTKAMTPTASSKPPSSGTSRFPQYTQIQPSTAQNARQPEPSRSGRRTPVDAPGVAIASSRAEVMRANPTTHQNGFDRVYSPDLVFDDRTARTPHILDSSLNESSPTPSLVSGSSASTHESPRAKVLRRKPSVISQYVAQKQKQQQMTKAGLNTEKSYPDFESSGILHVGLDMGVNSQSNFSSPDRSINRSQPPSSKPQWLDEPPPPPPSVEAMTKLYRHTPVSQTSVATSLPTSASPGAFSHATSLTSRTSCSPLVSTSPHMGPGAWTASSTPAERPRKKSFGSSKEPSGHPFFREAMALSAPNPEHVIPGERPNTSGSHASSLQDSSSTEVTPKIRPPPELAHLMVDNTPTLPESKSPPRPSRAHQPTLPDPAGDRPVIQSNLPKLSSTTHRRRTSLGSQSLSATTSPNPSSQPARKLSANNRPSRIATKTAASSSQSLPLPSPSPLSQQQSTPSAKSSTQSPSPVKQKSKFGLFSRKDKPQTSTVIDVGSKQPRKGPMAGTGHERYGKYAAGGRLGNTAGPPMKTSRPPSVGSASSASLRRKSNSSSQDGTLDDFLSQRLSPVYLRGGEGSISDGQNRGSSSTADDSVPRNSFGSSPRTYQTSQTSFDSARPTLASSALSQTESNDTQTMEEIRGRKSTDKGVEDSRRTLSRSQSRKRLTKSPKSSDKLARKSPGVESTSKVPLPLPSQTPPNDSTKIPDTKDETKAETNKKSKWSIRSKSSQGDKTASKWNFFHRSQPNITQEQEAPPLPQGPSKTMPYKSVAHYDLEDDDPGLQPFQHLGSIMQEAEALAGEDSTSIYTDFEDTDDFGYVSGRDSFSIGSRWLPPNHQNFSYDSVEPIRSNSFESSDPGKKSVEIGADKHQPQGRQPRLLQVGRIPKVVSSRDGDQMKLRTMEDERRQPSPLIPQPSSVASSTGPEFLQLNTRQNSDASYSGSSGTIYFPTAAATAAQPGNLSPPDEDEVWQEFDDFLHDVGTPPTLQSDRDSLAEVQDYFSRRSQDAKQTLTNSFKPALSGPIQATQIRRPATSSSAQREPVLKGILKPSKGYMNVDSRNVSRKRSSSLQQYRNNAPIRHKRSISDSDVPKAQRDIQEKDEETPTEIKRTSRSVVNLRFRALLASKWLSFGQVLFSPANTEIRDAINGRILVIDGLGKDWSYYCALTYPKATIYNLGPEPSTQNNRASLSGYESPANHQHFSHPGIGYNFPFPKGFFAAVVLRFPMASSDNSLQNAISECKRVLRPGGYLELSTLDLDLANMGTRARRALRLLKMQMQTARPDVSLKPTSDNMQYLIGRRGFENLNRCIVGVPVAGVIASSPEGSQEENDLDVSQLVNDQSKEGDEHITKMVARVGRWWYSHCYESILHRDDKDSIWEDKALLRECETMSTTFKLLICYAQKSTVTKRRTVSL